MFEPLPYASTGCGFQEDRRFGAAPAVLVAASAAEPDPVAEAYARGFAEGADCERAAAAERAALEQEKARVFEASFRQLDNETAEALRQQLQQTVLALCEVTLADAAIEPELLKRRIERALAMLARSGDERTIMLHPDDLARLGKRLPGDWSLAPDPSLERGALRIEAANGGIEDGPEQWRQALAEALRAC